MKKLRVDKHAHTCVTHPHQKHQYNNVNDIYTLPWVTWICVRRGFWDSLWWSVGFEEERLPSHMEIKLVFQGLHGEFHLPLPNPTPGSDDIAHHIDIYPWFWCHIEMPSTATIQGRKMPICHFRFIRFKVLNLALKLKLQKEAERTSLHQLQQSVSKQKVNLPFYEKLASNLKSKCLYSRKVK